MQLLPAIFSALASQVFSGLFGGGKSEPQQQAPQAPAAPPASQAAKTPGPDTFKRQNAQAEGPGGTNEGNTLLTAGGAQGAGPGDLGKAKLLGS